MSSADEDARPLTKKRKIQRACDYCRRKKIKCDGPQMPNNRCSKCISRRVECTYVESLHKSSYPSSYVENLENRLERMEKLIEKLRPDTDLPKELEDSQTDSIRTSQVSAFASGSSHREATIPLTPPSLAVTPQTPAGSDNFEPSDEEEGGVEKRLVNGISSLSLQASRYHGKSSGWAFIKNAMELKHRISPSQPKEEEKMSGRFPWLRHMEVEEIPIFEDFPPQDLMEILVELYFRKLNDHSPLLHEPSFKEAIKRGLHLREGGFGATVLLVCANGSRFTRDPRALLDGSDQQQSAGWKWFQEVVDARKPPLAPAQLYDIQIYVLMIFFLQGTTAPHATWTLTGIGIRAAVDVGAHRRKIYSPHPTPEEELWRRAFWILVCMEWTNSYGLGRPMSIHDEDIDVTLPTEVDDEYWVNSDGTALFQQPPGKPSKITAFNYLIRLRQILAFTTRTLYSTNKSKVQLGHGDQQWEQRIVTELDSTLNKWIDSLPPHLRWDPDQPNLLFLNQAAMLTSHYHTIHVAVHRPFISPSRRDSPLSYPSLIICTNAARSCIQVLDALCQRTGSPCLHNMGAIFMSAVLLATSVLGERRSGRIVNADRDLAYVEKCKDMLRLTRHEMHVSDGLWELLNDLTTVANPPTAPGPQGASVPASTESIPSTSRAESTRPPIDAHSRAERTAFANFPSLAALTFANSSTSVSSPFQRDDSRSPRQDKPSPLPTSANPASGAPPPGISATSYGKQPQRSSPSTTLHTQPTPTQFRFQFDVPPQSAASSSSPNAASPDQFDFGSMSMFGLEPLGYSEAVSLHPANTPMDSAPTAGGTGNQPGGTQYQFSGGTLGTTDQDYAEIPDFAFLDDAMTMWSNMPSSFRWEDWGTYSGYNAPNTEG